MRNLNYFVKQKQLWGNKIYLTWVTAGTTANFWNQSGKYMHHLLKQWKVSAFYPHSVSYGLASFTELTTISLNCNNDYFLMENQCVFCDVCTTFYILISSTSLNYRVSAVSITLIFIFTLLLLEGQMSDAWETLKSSFRNRRALDGKLLSFI